jgi:UDP-glucose 4-epimerase
MIAISEKYSEWYRGRTVTITGGYGYLGTSLCEGLRRIGATLRRATRGRAEISRDQETWTGDLTDLEFCRALVGGADIVFHLSAQTSIKTSYDDPFGDLRANVHSTLSLLEACKLTRRRPFFVYAGTATEVGFTEKRTAAATVDRPITVYDADKLAAEHLIGVYTANEAVHGLTLRIANVYGPGPSKSAGERGLINKMILRAMAGDDLLYYGDGLCLRDYVYVDDLLEAFFRAGAIADQARLRSYIIGAGNGYTLRETFELIANVIAEMGYQRVNVLPSPWPEDIHLIERRSYVADIRPLTEFSGWRPTVSLREGIRLTAEAFKKSGAVVTHAGT